MSAPWRRRIRFVFNDTVEGRAWWERQTNFRRRRQEGRGEEEEEEEEEEEVFRGKSDE